MKKNINEHQNLCSFVYKYKISYKYAFDKRNLFFVAEFLLTTFLINVIIHRDEGVVGIY